MDVISLLQPVFIVLMDSIYLIINALNAQVIVLSVQVLLTVHSYPNKIK